MNTYDLSLLLNVLVIKRQPMTARNTSIIFMKYQVLEAMIDRVDAMLFCMMG